MNYSTDVVHFIEAWEGFKPIASVDRLNPKVRDIGFGHNLRPGEEYGRIDWGRGELILHADLSIVAAGVSSLVKVPLTQNKFDALCAFAFNVGLDIDEDNVAEGLGDSTLLKYINAAQFDKAALQFTLWCHVGKTKVDGLLKRRFAEQVMFTHNDYTRRP